MVLFDLDCQLDILLLVIFMSTCFIEQTYQLELNLELSR
jgi:hypothetical protein